MTIKNCRARSLRALTCGILLASCALLAPLPLSSQPAIPPTAPPQPAASPPAQTPAAPARSSASPRYGVNQGGDISLNYVDTDVREIVRLILGEILKVNYAIDPGFQGNVTIQTARPLKRDDLISTLQGLLAQAGGQLTYQNNIYRVSAQGDDTNIPPLVAGASMEAGAQVVTLRYASAKQLATILETYAGEGVKVLADPARNVLIISGTASARQNIVGLIRVFDMDYLAGRSYALFPAKSGDPIKFAADLEAALQLDADGALTGAVKVVPIEQANAVMVITRQSEYLDKISRMVDQIDKVKLSAGRNIHVYRLKNTQPADIQPVLQRAVNPPGGGSGTEEIAPGNLPPTATPARIGGGPATGGATAAASGTNGTQAGQAPATTAGAPQTPRPADNGNGQQTGADAKGPQIIADSINGALIIVATDSEYETIEAAIRKLDILPMQVLVEATIAEVSLNRQLQYGVQFFLQNSEGQIALSNAQSVTPTVIDPSRPISNASLFPGVLAPSFPGFAVARTFGDVQVTLQALKSITDVHIVSAPKLMILDRQQASFQVGDMVPTITQSATSVITAGAPVVNNVQYQPTGVILSVTPHINAGGLVTLDIEQEVSDVVPTTTSSINSPTFQQRRIKTKVIVQDGETISLAGLISEKKSSGNSGVPLLQDIPVFGTLFSTKINDRDRTELIVLLTPRVVHDQREAKALTEELKRKLTPSSILP
ncbi:MAG TPA: type II secretion system secretin GspD [Rhizomicrobium sp.]|nr:type II secretion system secretin GspD [Rhizomicrobium sp.]